MRSNPKDPTETARQPADNGWIVWVSASLMVLSLGIYACVMLATPGFARLYAGFGTELPAITGFALSAAPFAIALSLVSIVPFVNLLRARRTGAAGNGFAWVVASAVLAVAILGAWAYAMYLPILELGAAVS